MIYQHIQGLIQKGIDTKLIDPIDQIYVRNQVLDLLNLQSFPETVETPTDDSIPNIVETIIDYAVLNDVIEDVFDDKEILSANIMNCFVARPSIINNIFWDKYNDSPQEATNYFYDLSKNSNYIQMNRIRKNIHFKADTEYG